MKIFEQSEWTKKILNPAFYKDEKFDSNIRKKLLKIASDFYKDLDMKFKIKDIWLTGSNASYNYTKLSDLDVHIIVDFNKIPVDNNILDKLFRAKKSLWNNVHDITIKGHEVEMYVQDSNEEHSSNGIYSLLKDEWIKKPKYSEPQTSKELVKQKAEKIMSKIDQQIRSFKLSIEEDDQIVYNNAKSLKENIVNMRKEGLKTPDGIFSLENLVFKELRNNGYLEKLIKLMHDSYDNIYTENKIL